LDKYYNMTKLGTAAAMTAALAGPAKRGEPVFGYYWAPTALMGAYEWQHLEEPPWTEECWAEVSKGQFDRTYRPKQACAYSSEPITKAVHKSFPQKAPDLVELLKKMNFGLEPLNKTLAWAMENEINGNWERAGVYYLRTYEERWTTWMPPEKVQMVKAALAKAN
jgi:glycine betaine/proline transport system substrate-binding protein